MSLLSTVLPVWHRKSWDNEFDRMDAEATDEMIGEKFKEFLEKQTRLMKMEVEREREQLKVRKLRQSSEDKLMIKLFRGEVRQQPILVVNLEMVVLCSVGKLMGELCTSVRNFSKSENQLTDLR